MKTIIKLIVTAIMRGVARVAVAFNRIFRHDRSAQNPAGKGTGNEARPRKRLVDGVDADRFTQLCVVLVIGFVTLIGAVLITAAVNSGSRQIPVDDSPAAENKTDSFVLTLGGNMMPSSDMIGCAKSEDGYNFNNQLSGLSAALSGDLTIAGLCGQIDAYDNGESVSGFDEGKNYPAELAAALSDIGVNYVFGANRYAFANGYDGMCATISRLHTHSVGVIGLTDTDPQKLNTRVLRVNGIGVGVAGYNCLDNADYAALTDEQKTYIAQPGKDADALVERATADMAKMRSSGAEFMVICINWGGAGSLAPADFIKQTSRRIAEAGADVIVGYGAFVTLDTEIMTYSYGNLDKECYIFYSLGALYGDNRYSSKTLETLNKAKQLTDAQKKQLADEKKKAAAINQAMSGSMTVSLKAVRAKNGSVSVESAVCRPIYLLKNTVQGEENAHLKYMAIEAGPYVSAETRPDIFADDKQWQLCRETFTRIGELAAKTDGKLVLADPVQTSEESDDKSDTKI